MNREIEWTRHASESLEELGPEEHEIEAKLHRKSRWRRNPGKADWRAVIELSEYPLPFVVLFDYPVDEDDLLVKVVTVWESE
jgi:hypothetical protein